VAKKQKVKKSSNQNPSSSKFMRSPLFWVLTSLMVAVAGYFVYKIIHYHSAPEEIKKIRQLPIYNYESDTLKIVDRREDYGGTDWKGVYIQPKATISFTGKNGDTDYQDCVAELQGGLSGAPLSRTNSYISIGNTEKTYVYDLNVKSGDGFRVIIRPSGNGASLCATQISTR